MNKTDKNSFLTKLTFYWQKIDNKSVVDIVYWKVECIIEKKRIRRGNKGG